MSIYLIDKIKHANGTDPVVDAEDVVLQSGERLEDVVSDLRSGGGFVALTQAQYTALAAASMLDDATHYLIVKVASFRPTGLTEEQMEILESAGLLPGGEIS